MIAPHHKPGSAEEMQHFLSIVAADLGARPAYITWRSIVPNDNNPNSGTSLANATLAFLDLSAFHDDGWDHIEWWCLCDSAADRWGRPGTWNPDSDMFTPCAAQDGLPAMRGFTPQTHADG